ncbi:MAG: hypothetical protein LBH75_06660 [Treponema sp.]|jgi:hypothetical protein|nr:hypothetical protein [Treponema sp.]
MIKRLFLIFLTGLALLSCSQDHIFYKISQEVEPNDPRITGGPTTIIQLGGALYSASRMGRTVHVYDKGADDSWRWNRLPPPGGKIIELAGDGKSLFALTGEPMETARISKYDGQAWTEIASGYFETIAGAGNGTEGRIFAATKTTVSVYPGADGGFTEIATPEAMLMGAAYLNNVFYLAVAKKGVFIYDGGAFSAVAVGGSEGKNTVGILTVENEVVAVTREGGILRGDLNGFDVAGSIGSHLSGGMGLWKEDGVDGVNTLLLIGLQDNPRYTTKVLGYREIVLENGALPSGDTLEILEPGEHSPSTVSNYDKYEITLRIHIVTDIAQAGDDTLFAATTKNGLWSYRHRNGVDVWNAEE